jgi:mannan endo-1,4-beta-mannosidase
MSSFVKSLDPNHMVAVGDEGFLSEGRNNWAYETPYGVDSASLTGLAHVDFGTYHLYPDHWAQGHLFGNDWIEDHIALSRRVGKPVVLEEYGIHVRRLQETSGPVVHGWPRRQVAYLNWNNLVLERGGQASMFWILSGIESPGKPYPDYDHFTVYDGDESYQLLASYAQRMPAEAAACTLAGKSDQGPKSPFVSARATPAPDASSP